MDRRDALRQMAGAAVAGITALVLPAETRAAPERWSSPTGCASTWSPDGPFLACYTNADGRLVLFIDLPTKDAPRFIEAFRKNVPQTQNIEYKTDSIRITFTPDR